MEEILPSRLKTPSVSSRKTLVKDKKPISVIMGTKSSRKADKNNDRDDSSLESLTPELNFIKDTLLQMATDDEVNAKKVKQRKEAFATKNKAVNLKAKCGQSGDQKSIEHVSRGRVKKSSKDPTWKSLAALKKMSASERLQIITSMDKKCAKWADKYKSCMHEKDLLAVQVEDLNAIQLDLQTRLNKTIRDNSAFFGGKELDDPLTRQYYNHLVRNSRLIESLKETETKKEALFAETTVTINKLEECQAFLVLNKRQQRQLKEQNRKLKRSIQQKNRLIEQIKEPAPIMYTLKS